jgi:nucleoside-diphosphate-sugar epimerase
MARDKGIKRFIYASSSSVYGVKDEENVTEEMALKPLTDYSKYKALCEEILLRYSTNEFVCLVLRPATVCGFSSRQRLDLVVNILTNHAVNKGKITVFGGTQRRPNIHIDDITDLYCNTLEYDSRVIGGNVFNAGYENHTLLELAELVKGVVGPQLEVKVEQTDDLRSYHISSERIKRQVGFKPTRNIETAVKDLKNAFDSGLLTDPMNNSLYYNIKRMKEVKLK